MRLALQANPLALAGEPRAHVRQSASDIGPYVREVAARIGSEAPEVGNQEGKWLDTVTLPSYTNAH